MLSPDEDSSDWPKQTDDVNIGTITTSEHWLPHDVYFGSTEIRHNWREHASASDTDDDAEPTAEEKQAVKSMLGFDPAEADEENEEDEEDEDDIPLSVDKHGHQHKGKGKGGGQFTKIDSDDAREDYAKNGVKAKAFKDWFGDWEDDPESASKVVDSEGKPKKQHKVREVYHGTKGKFVKFDPNKVRYKGVVGPGFYFAEDRRIAETFAKREWEDNPKPGKILTCYLNIRNPFDLGDVISQDEVKQWSKKAKEIWGDKFDQAGFEKSNKPISSVEKLPDRPAYGHSLHRSIKKYASGLNPNDLVQAMGYDGITHMSADEKGTPSLPNGRKDYGRCWIAFVPNQIKSIDNRGTFRSDSDNINLSTDKSGHEHGEKGSGHGGQFVSKESIKSILADTEATIAKADEIATKFSKQPLKWAKEKAERQYDKLVTKYGAKGAFAIWATGQVITWGLSVGLPLAGIPVIVPPGGGLATSAVLAAMVDKYRKLRGKGDKTMSTDDTTLSTDPLGQEEIVSLAAELVQELIDEAYADESTDEEE